MIKNTKDAARAIKCRVDVRNEHCHQTYYGIFASTCDAVIDAMRRVSMPCMIIARAIK